MFYDRYVELCRKNGMSPTGVARKVGISSRTAADWAFGAEPRPSTAKKIADFFGVDVSYFYEEAEIQKMQEYYATTGNLAAGAALIMIFTGMRWGEISTIKPTDIHLDEGYLIGGIKTDAGKHGEIILIDRIKPIVADIMIPSNRIGKLSSEGFRKAYNAMQEHLEIERHTVHECRHTTATMLAKAGVQAAVIADIMRHSSYAQTMDYTHTDREDMKKGIEKIIR